MQLLKTALPILCILVSSAELQAQTLQQYKDISDSFYYAGKCDTALMYAAKAEAIIIRDSGINSSAYAYFAGQFFAMNYEKMGDIKNAVYWYAKSISLFKSLHDTLSFGYGETNTNYGNLATNLGSYSEALPYLLTGESILKKYPLQADSYGGALNNLANVYNYTGLYSKAEGYYIDLLKLLEKAFKTDENYYAAKVYSNLANVYNKTGLWQKAEENFVKALSIFRKIKGHKDEYYTIYIRLGQLYAARKNTTASNKIFNEIADSLPQTQNVVLYALALNGLGQVMQQQHKWNEAETYYLSALHKLQQEETKNQAYYAVGSNLASLYAARFKFVKTDSVLRSLLHEYALSKDRDQYYYLQVFSGFCANLIRTNKLSEAADSIQSLTQHLFHTINRNLEGMPQSEKLQFAETLKTNFDLVYSLLASGKTSNKEMIRLGLYESLQLKGMILSNQTRLYNELRNTSEGKLTEAYNNWLKMQQILYTSYARSYKSRTLNTDSLEALSDGYERKFSAGREVTEDKDIVIEKIRESLLPTEAALEFVRFNSITAAKDEVMYGAFIMTRAQAEPQFVVLCKERELKKIFTGKKGRWIGSDKQLKEIELNSSSTRYALLWKPLEQYVKNFKTIYYSPAGIINSISLNAISTGNKGLLIDHYHLCLVSGTKNLIDKTVSNKSKITLATIWGRMNYSKEVYLHNKSAKQQKPVNATLDKALLSDDYTKGGLNEQWNAITIEETDELKNIFAEKKIPLKTYKSRDATEENFKRWANGSSGIIHISTHGFFAPAGAEKQAGVLSSSMYTTHVNPLLRCGLIFSGANYVWSGNEPLRGKEDGILTGYEIAQMDLRKVNLVVLSACETALGDLDEGDEGVIGLQRAFKLAGAGKLIVSLWKVPPKQTAELMIRFYKKLLNGESASTALLHAQKEMRKKYPPYYWAAFVLIE